MRGVQVEVYGVKESVNVKKKKKTAYTDFFSLKFAGISLVEKSTPFSSKQSLNT